MTEGKKIGQWLVGIVLLFLFLVTAFIPWITLSGDDYVDAAVNVHEYAREQDAVVADAAGAFTFISSYQKDSDLRNAWVVSYEKGIKSRFGNKTSFSGFTWGRWCLRESTPLVLPQIQFENYFSNQKSAGRKIFSFMGCFIYLPILIAAGFLVFCIVKRRLYSFGVMLTGTLAVLFDLILYFAVPGAIWRAAGGSIHFFSLVSEKMLAIRGVGSQFIKEVYHHAGGIGAYANFILACMLCVTGSVFFILTCVQKRREKKVEFFQNQSLENMPLPGDAKAAACGTLTGICGQYAGQSLTVNAGEEIVLGRDPAYSMLVFDNRGISRRHCGIRYDDKTGNYFVIDYSSTGTKMADGRLVTASSYSMAEPGTVLLLGDGEEQFLLK